MSQPRNGGHGKRGTQKGNTKAIVLYYVLSNLASPFFTVNRNRYLTMFCVIYDLHQMRII